jgi:uncharacterized protein YyaL (SSP411 family)
MLAALAKAGRLLAEPKFVETAEKTADFLLTKMRRDDVLYHRYFEGETAVEGFLDDYAFLVFGLIELYEATFQDKYLHAASDLAKDMIAKFWDSENGGFYQAQTGPAGLPKIKQIYDGATPSGNSVALYDLVWLSRLTNEAAYEEMAYRMTKTFAREVEGLPDAHAFFLSAFSFLAGPFYGVTVVGDPAENNAAAMLEALKKHYLPTTTVTLKQPSKTRLDFQQIDGKATAYVCQNQTCLPPTNSITTMLEHLGVKSVK